MNPKDALNMWAILDTETTNLDEVRGEIIEIAILTNNNRPFCCKVQPERIEDAHPKALEINGYTPEAWSNAWPAKMVEPYITELLLGRTVIGHNPFFDMRHLKKFYERLGLQHRFQEFDYHYIDTTTLAYEHLVPHGLDRYSLWNICDFLRISNEGSHGALVDTQRTLEVFETLRRPSRWNRHIGFRLMGIQYKARQKARRKNA